MAMVVECKGAAWRDETSYRYVAALGRAEIAWELLRRNRAYRRAAADCSLEARTGHGFTRIAAVPGCGPLWGLSFRASGRSSRHRSPALLARHA